MDRRNLLIGAGATGFAYIWIPRIDVVRANPDSREALVKVGRIIANNLGGSKLGTTSAVASGSLSMEPEKLSRSLDTLSEHNYDEFSANYYESRSRRHAMFGGYNDDGGYCHAYTHPKKSDEAIAYATSVVFVCHSHLLEACAEEGWPQDKMNAYLYPSETIAYWKHDWGDSFGAASNEPPVHVHCERGTWTVEYDADSKTANVALLDRDTLESIVERTVEFS
jgi:hypothetical protein